MTLRQRTILIGGVTGGAAASACLGAAFVLGPGLGPALGVAAAACLGAAGAVLVVRALESPLRAHLAALGGGAAGLSSHSFPPVGDPELDDLLDGVQQAIRRSRQIEAEVAEVERMARSVWASFHGKPDASNPSPEARRCIAGLVEMFQQTAETLRRCSTSLEEANERMAQGALDQTETVARTTTTVEALSDKIDRISQNADDASGACERTRQEARRGLEQVHRVIEGMDRLRAQIEVNGRKVRRLGDRSVEIGTIVELIRGISSRTDMLALNATIESVRAGEHGRGFAVVAEEIRKLSERTAGATRDIGTLVEAIQADTNESIRALSEEQSEMEQEVQRVRDAGTALERISQVAEQSAQLVDGISRSSNDQVLAAQELVRAMQRISDVSHLTLERSTRSRESIRGLAQWCERLTPLMPGDVKPAVATPLGDLGDPTAGPPSWRKRRHTAGARSS
ncbi:MAG: methyl-accepting chemotaxis protein [Isosphaeraceae bacterium]